MLRHTRHDAQDQQLYHGQTDEEQHYEMARFLKISDQVEL